MLSWLRLVHRLGIAALLLPAAGALFGQETRQRAPAPPAQNASVLLIAVQDAIGPATADYVVHGIAKAEQRGAALAVLALDTPGGLDSSMRRIIQAILGSSVPVATFVSPPGARAASAGTYILYASHIAAMAPATNVGAATPVQIGGGFAPSPPSSPPEGDRDGSRGRDNAAEPPDGAESKPSASAEERKVVNDAVAYIRSLAERRGRNAEWAEQAVRSAASLSARSALEKHVIDLMADNVPDLLDKLDGRTVMLPAGAVTLHTRGAVVERFDPGWRTRFLAVITNPTVAYLLLLIGIYGLLLEGFHPGGVLPGVLGGISLLLALFAFQILPINYAGLGLIALGVILMIAEAFAPSFGALGFGGIASFVLGSVILMNEDVPGYEISKGLIAGIAAAGGLAMLGTIGLALKARRRPVVSGAEDLTQGSALALEDFETEGAVLIHGERWRARSSTPIHKGQMLRVRKVEGLLLHVEPAGDAEEPQTTARKR